MPGAYSCKNWLWWLGVDRSAISAGQCLLPPELNSTHMDTEWLGRNYLILSVWLCTVTWDRTLMRLVSRSRSGYPSDASLCLPDLPWVVRSRHTREHRGDLAMTDPEDTPQDTELDPESSTDEASTDVNQKPEDEATVDVTEEGSTADYQARLSEFDNVESPVSVVGGSSDQAQ